MKYVPLVILLFSFSSFSAVEKCPLEHLENINKSDVECQFYLGVRAYNDENFTKVVKHWEYVINTPAKYKTDHAYKVQSLSTVAYLTYHGKGVKTDRLKAMDMWVEASKKGILEARTHLGTAYSDIENTDIEIDLIKALGWFKSVSLIGPEAPNSFRKEIETYNQAIELAKEIENKLTPEQQIKALEFAQNSIK